MPRDIPIREMIAFDNESDMEVVNYSYMTKAGVFRMVTGGLRPDRDIAAEKAVALSAIENDIEVKGIITDDIIPIALMPDNESGVKSKIIYI